MMKKLLLPGLFAVLCLTTFLLMLNSQSDKSISEDDSRDIKIRAEKFAKIMYSMKHDESYNSKKERVEHLITDELSQKLFAKKDTYNIYDDISVKELDIKQTGTSVILRVVQSIPDQIRTTDSDTRTLDAELKFIKKNDQWMIDEFIPVEDK